MRRGAAYKPPLQNRQVYNGSDAMLCVMVRNASCCMAKHRMVGGAALESYSCGNNEWWR